MTLVTQPSYQIIGHMWSRRLAPADIEDIRKHLQDLLKAGIIKESDQYTTPRIDDALDCLNGSRWFSVLVLRSGYYQIAMSEADRRAEEKRPLTAHWGFTNLKGYRRESLEPL